MHPIDETTLQDLSTWTLNPQNDPPEWMDGVEPLEVAYSYFNRLFLPEPHCVWDKPKIEAFEALMRHIQEKSDGHELPYQCPYPKYEFLRYLAERKPYLLHGSSNMHIPILKPGKQEDGHGHWTQAVFAAGDAVMSMYMALLNRSALAGSIRSGFFVINRSGSKTARFYFFSVHKGSDLSKIFSSGMVYVCPNDTFQRLNSSPVRFDEWLSHSEVPIVGRLRVEQEDFPFGTCVISEHVSSESIFKTWMGYKSRIDLAT